MQQITVLRADLQKTLTINHENHVKAYKLALAGYQKEALRQIDEMRAKLVEDPAFRVILTEMPPQNHGEDYLRALRMLDMATGDVVQITHDDFTRYVDDDWDWKHGWSVSNAKYLGRVIPPLRVER